MFSDWRNSPKSFEFNVQCEQDYKENEAETEIWYQRRDLHAV